MLLLMRWEHQSLDSEIIENFCSKDFDIPKIFIPSYSTKYGMQVFPLNLEKMVWLVTS